MPEEQPFRLYEQDFDTWATVQAQALRAVPEAVMDSADCLRAIDWKNVAGEIEGLARKDRRHLTASLALIVELLVKLEFSVVREPRAAWIYVMRRERAEIASILRDSPCLRREVPDILARRSDESVKVAAEALEAHGETAEAMEARMRRFGIGYQPEEILGTWIPIAAEG